MRHEINHILLRFRQNLFLCLLLWIIKSRGQVSQPHDSEASTSRSLGSSFFFYNQPEYPRDCQEVFTQCSATNASGVYLIQPDGCDDAFEVYCDNSKQGGGWTVFHRRTDGSVDFFRPWEEYKTGFGFLANEFWLGNEKLSFLINQKKYEIRIDIENAAGSSFFIHYTYFRISDEWNHFTLNGLGQFSGTADSFIMGCPVNMEYGNCTCQPTCEDPDGIQCQTLCIEKETCICGDGYLKKGHICVPPEECGCYIEGKGVISNDETYISSDCTSLCECRSNVLTCDRDYSCSPDATCGENDDEYQCFCNDGFAGDGESCTVIGTDCDDIYNAGLTESGVYIIKPTNWSGSSFKVYCNMTDGGGWTVFQRRVNGSENFYLGWNDYKYGFGQPNHELWLGNDRIYYMTNKKNYQLRIDFVDRVGSPYFVKYDLFRISDETDKYRLVGLGSFTGNAGYDALNWHKNMPFSTYDMDNDGWASYNCAERHRGAWWYRQGNTYSSCSFSIDVICNHWILGSTSCGWCSHCSLNGEYNDAALGANIHWDNLPGYDCNIVYTEMKIKPI